MAKIQNETAYKAAMARIEELLPLVNDDTPLDDRNLIELDLLSELVSDYEDEHYQIKTPALVDVIKLRMYEMGLNQVKLSELLGVSTSRVSDYLTDIKMNLFDKRRQLVVTSADGRIIWLVNQRPDNRCRLTSETKFVLKITYEHAGK